MNQMQELNERVKAAVARGVAAGKTQEESFKNHIMCLASEYPAVFGAYMNWLASR